MNPWYIVPGIESKLDVVVLQGKSRKDLSSDSEEEKRRRRRDEKKKGKTGYKSRHRYLPGDNVDIVYIHCRIFWQKGGISSNPKGV